MSYNFVFDYINDKWVPQPFDASSSGSGSLSDRSGAIQAGGTAQQLMPSNTARRGFYVSNRSSGDLWINANATASAGAGSIKIPAGALYETPPGGAGIGAVSIFGATTGQGFTAKEF
jgi:hypothetical protein